MGKRKRTREREPADGTRTVRLQELIREEVNFMLRSEVRDPRLEGVVVTMVELAGDGSRARLWSDLSASEIFHFSKGVRWRSGFDVLAGPYFRSARRRPFWCHQTSVISTL